MHQIRRSIRRMLPAAAAIVCLAGIGVRLTVRDSFAPMSVLFYALPPAMLTILALFAFAGWWIAARYVLACAAAITALACGVWCFQTQFVFHPSQPAGASRRVLFWNTCRFVLGRKAIIDRIRTFDADVIGLVEIGERTPGTDPMWEDSFPGYRVEALDGQMLLLTKGDLVATASHKLGDNSRCHVVNIRLHGSPLTVVLVDLASDPLGDHGGSISKLREVTASLADDPIIVMGDFNTPSDSVFLDSMRSQMINAFEAAGNGYSATWPVPMPLIAIDQVWVSRLVDIRNCRLCWSLQSDHRGVVTDIVWRNQKLNRDE